MHYLNIHPSPNLIFKLISLEDENLIFKLRSNEEVIKFTDISLYTDIAQARDYINKILELMQDNKCILWSISLYDETQIGSICLWNYSEDLKSVELGYDLLPEFWGRGYAKEAIGTVTAFAFKRLNFERIAAVTRADNVRSNKVLKRSGFSLDEIFFENDILVNKYIVLSDCSENNNNIV